MPVTLNRSALRIKLLAMLDEYCNAAAEHEDETTYSPNEPLSKRMEDFVLYFAIKYGIKD